MNKRSLAQIGYTGDCFRAVYSVVAGEKFTKANDVAVADAISRAVGADITYRQVENMRGSLGMVSFRRPRARAKRSAQLEINTRQIDMVAIVESLISSLSELSAALKEMDND